MRMIVGQQHLSCLDLEDTLGERMNISCWVYAFTQNSRDRQDALAEILAQHGVSLEQLTQDGASVPGVCICSEVTPEFCTFLRNVSRAGRERILVLVDSM